jgi:hypothetical protein
MRVPVTRCREDAHAFYRGMGFEETGKRFAKRLD